MKKIFTFIIALLSVGNLMAATSMTCAEASVAALSVAANNIPYNNGDTIEVQGYVTQIQTAYSNMFHNITFWMADSPKGGNVLQAYRAVCATSEDAPSVGDLVKVTGNLTRYNSTPEFAAGCTYVFIQRHVYVEFTSVEFNGQGTSGTGSEVTATKDGVTFTCDKAYGDQYGVRCFKNGVLTISSTNQRIGKIVFEFTTVSGKYYNGDLADTIDVYGTEWTHTMKNQARMNKITVYLGNYFQVKTITIPEEGSIQIVRDPLLVNNVVLLTAIPNYGFHFTQWSDGVTDNPRTIELSRDTTVEAIFAKNPTITYNYDAEYGVVIGDTTTSAGIEIDSITFEAKANYGYHFVQWSDGVTDNPRTIELSQDTTFSAQFAKNTYFITTASANEIEGTTKGDTSALYLEQVEIQAIPYYGYHFDHWNDGNTNNTREITITKDETYTAYFVKNIYSISKISNEAQGNISGNSQAEYMDSITVTANPNRGFYFVQWADGNTDNPRIVELTQDTTMEAIFDYLLSGKCGKDSVLTWTFNPAKMALEITGKGALSENYSYGTFIEDLTIGNEISQIGQCAFYGCSNLQNVIIGSSVKVLEGEAFHNCSSIETITCYSQRPPTVNNQALYGLDYSTIVYVLADYLNTYQMHDAWGLYDVRPLGAKSTETTEVNVTPAETTAEVVWPAVSGAATYELVIKDKSGNVICTLFFNAKGQLTQIAFSAPARNYAPQQTQATGFSFTITGLEEGTSYDLTITAKDSNGATLQENTVSFNTTGGEQGVEEVLNNGYNTKVIRDAQIFIIRDDKTYTLTGQVIE